MIVPDIAFLPAAAGGPTPTPQRQIAMKSMGFALILLCFRHKSIPARRLLEHDCASCAIEIGLAAKRPP
jgi:hypothetical protein